MSAVTTYDAIVERLNRDGKVIEFSLEESEQITTGIEKDMEEFRLDRKQKERESQLEIFELTLTA